MRVVRGVIGAVVDRVGEVGLLVVEVEDNVKVGLFLTLYGFNIKI